MSKKLLIVVISALFISFQMRAEWIQLNGQNKSQAQPNVTLISDDANSSIFKIEISGFDLKSFNVKGQEYQSVDLLTESFTTEPGFPAVPYIAKVFAIPDQAAVLVEILETGEIQTFENIHLPPARESWFEGDPETPYNENMEAYGVDGLFPYENVNVDNPSIFRDFRIARVAAYPVRYNPAKNEIQVVTSMTVRVNYGSGQVINPKTSSKRPIAPSFGQLYKDLIFNYQSVLEDSYGGKEDGHELMLCIMPDDFYDSFLPYAEWKRQSGIDIHITKFSDIGANSSNPDIIRDHIADAYFDWEVPPTYALLVGDADLIPYYTSSGYIDENYYVEIDGGDFFPDVMLGRFTNQSDYTLQVMVNKFQKYEQTPYVADTDWFKKGICCSNDAYPSQVTTKEFAAERMLVDGEFTSVDEMMSDPGCTYNNNDVTNAINEGRSFLNYRGEGWTSGWWASCTPFTVSQVSNLSNGEKFTFVTSIGCGVAMFGSGESFGEAWMELGTLSQPRGGACFIGPAGNTHTTYNNKIDKGIYVGMFHEGLVTSGQGFLRGKLYLYNVYGTDPNVQYHYKIYCILGDPSMQIWKDVPLDVDVEHAPVVVFGTNMVEFTVNHTASGLPVENAKVCVTGDDVFVTGVTDNSGIAYLEITADEPEILIVTVTGGTVYPFQGTMEVTTPMGPWCLKDYYSLDDSAGGNGDSLMDYSESFLLSLALENIGNKDAIDVIVEFSTTDPYLTFADAHIKFPSIPAGQSVLADNTYLFTVADDIPDEHEIFVNVNATMDNMSWTSYLSMIGHAPVLSSGGLTIYDPDGNNNGLLDPGETATIIIPIANDGSSMSPDATASLGTINSYITLNTTSVDLGPIDIGETSEASFSVTVSSEAPVGESIDLDFILDAGSYGFSEMFFASIGVMIEDWETGDFNKFPWSMGGNADWTIVTDSPYEGVYCARSGSISHSQNSELEVTFNVTGDGNVTFYRKVSSENGYDYLRFYIDGNMMDQWSGNHSWQQFSYPVSAGSHTFKWQYSKDNVMSSGEDCAWIDYIVFPYPIPPVVPPYLTEFDEGGSIPEGWYNDIENDDFDWSINSGSTPSPHTGPSGDHTTGTGYYFFTEATWNNPDFRADLITPSFDLSTLADAEVRFWYHMWDDDYNHMGILHLDVFHDYEWIEDVMVPISGNQGDQWFEQVVDLSAYAGGIIKLRFRGITGADWASDICIDDFSMVGTLTPSDVTDDYVYNDSWGKAGYTVELQNASKVIVNYSIEEFGLTDMEIDGKSFQNIELPGNFLPNDAGSPNLPGSGRYIAIPQGADASLEIVSYRTETIENVELAPSFRIPFDNENKPLEYKKNESIYSDDKLFPEEPIKLSENDMIRGVDFVKLGITPYQYNPVSKQLIVFRDIKVEISFNGGNGNFGEERLRSRWWDPILSDMLLNYETLPKMDYNRSFQSKDETGCEYLIIVPNDIAFTVWADSIRKFRTTQGIYTDIATLNEIGGNTPELIEGYIDMAYSTWDIVPVACLLLGDYGTSASDRITAPLWENYCVSDNIYGDVGGNGLPDIVMARITAQDEIMLDVMVRKFLSYETSPPTNEEFYQYPVTSLGWQTDAWYQLCSEVVGGFWREAQGKDPIRMNEILSGTPGDVWSTAPNTDAIVNYFGPNGLGYIPEQPSTLGGWTGGTAAGINLAVDTGTFMVQHRDHGYEEGWGQPDYTNTNVNTLINTKLTFVWSTDALTGKFNYGSEVFAEKFHRHTHKEDLSGCFGINAPTEITYAFVSDVFVWGAFDYMWPDFAPDFGVTPEPRGVLPAFASASAKYFLDQSSWPSNSEFNEATYHLFHHHGDAFTTVYSEVPQDLFVSHDDFLYMGEATFEVTADVDALIGLSVNGELIGTGIGTGSPVTIEIPAQAPPDMLLVTVTKQNYFRYESFVEIIPATGPYVVYNEIEINDNSGNGNGIMETSESILASLTIKNVGVEDAQNVVVSLSSEDSYVTITDNSENYGTISSGSTSVVTDGFAWEVADNIPDMHVVNFELSITDGTFIWESSFNITGHAPLLDIGTMLIDDYIGNWNGQLDPDETAFVIIQTFNNGSYNAASAIGSLNCTNEYITLNNLTFNFYDIGVGIMEEGMFEVEVSEDAPVGTYVDFLYEVTSGGYSSEHIFSTRISPVVEDWESGDMSQFNWETGGDADWDVAIENPYEGGYCAKSGELDHDQNSFLSIEYDVNGQDSLSFWCKVSSETSYDYLMFYIDDVEMESWTGEIDWVRSSFLVSEGTHTFKWMYEKDETLSSGYDRAWVDFIMFPVTSQLTAAFSSDVTDICEDESVSFYDQSIGAISWDWTFEGGTPGTSTLQNPVVTYSSAGEYDVSLTVSDGSEDNTVVIENYISVDVEPGQAPAPTGPETVCGNSASTSYSTSGIIEITTYDWELEPSNAGTVEGTGLTTNVIWTADFLGEATLKVAGENNCGMGPYSNNIAITRYLPEVTLEPFDTVCVDWPEFELLGGMPAGGEYSGPGVENGWFNPGIAGLGTHTIIYTYSDPDDCENFAEEMIVVDACTGMSEISAGTELLIFPNPGKGTFNIRLNIENDKIDIRLFNAMNEQVYKRHNQSLIKDVNYKIDLNHLPAGIYYMHVSGNDVDLVKKIIIQN